MLVEAGATLCGQFVDQGLLDEYWVYVAPKAMGASARPLLSLDFIEMNEAIPFEFKDVSMLGKDLRLIARPVVSNTD